jgi:hypothetical protein
MPGSESHITTVFASNSCGWSKQGVRKQSLENVAWSSEAVSAHGSWQSRYHKHPNNGNYPKFSFSYFSQKISEIISYSWQLNCLFQKSTTVRRILDSLQECQILLRTLTLDMWKIWHNFKTNIWHSCTLSRILITVVFWTWQLSC